MRLVASGPDLPAELMKSQETGRLVFFCGAGVSCNVGLPLFPGLVDGIYEVVGANKEDNSVEKLYHDSKEYDFVLGALEERLADANAVRRAIWQILQIRHGTGLWGLHEALLRLSLKSDHRLQLVTTNYDQAFKFVAQNLNLSIKEFAAPLLPIPKFNQWNGLVYLHGFLQESCGDTELQNLVVTSGDFGRAYLTERWAARFISELFRNFDICFVGYSLNDPVLRYAVDALAADRKNGESTRAVWAFVSYDPERPNAAQEEWKKWKGKGVQPILYPTIATSFHRHRLLYDTFIKWADLIRDGLFDGEAVVARLATKIPRVSASDDDVSQMLWALAEPEGNAAHRLAHFNPLPPWEWVEVVMNASLSLEALERLGIDEEKLWKVSDERPPFYSLFRRPMVDKPWWCSPFQVVVTKDRLLLELEEWLARYIDDPRLFVRVLWEGLSSSSLREKFLKTTDVVGRVRKTLMEDEPESEERKKLYFLWLLLLTGQVQCGSGKFPLNYEAKYLNPLQIQSYKKQVVALLKPLVCWQYPLTMGENVVDNLFREAKVELAVGVVDKSDLKFGTLDDEGLVDLLKELERLLSDALGLVKALGQDARGGTRRLPSVEPHSQNKTERSWEQLIEIIRDVWLQLLKSSVDRASAIAAHWFTEKSFVFKRLSLFAASQPNVIMSDIWLNWLLDDSQACLWHPYCKREVCRLLVNRGRDLSPGSLQLLEEALWEKLSIAGEDRHHAERMVALRLTRLQMSSATLSSVARQWMQLYSRLCTVLSAESNEFIAFFTFHWIDADEEIVKYLPKSVEPKELAVWLSERPEKVDECWEFICQKENKNAFVALIRLAEEDQWPITRWTSAFYAVSKKDARDRWLTVSAYLVELVEKTHDKDFFKTMLSWLVDVADERAQLSGSDVTQLIEILTASFPKVEENDESPSDGDDCIDWAINQTAQKLTDVLVSLCFKHVEEGKNGLPENCIPLLTAVCNKPTMRAGWFWLAVHLVFFAQRDFDWTSRCLLPKFGWSSSNNPREVLGMWQGFLSSPQNVPELMAALKTDFMQTAEHYEEFQLEKDSYVFFLTYLAVMGAEGYATHDFRQLFHQLPKEALPTVIEALTQGISSDSEKAQQFWDNRIKVFWQDVFPKDKKYVSKELSKALALLAIAAKTNFPEACRLFEAWFLPLEFPETVEQLLTESRLESDYPKEVTDFKRRLGLSTDKSTDAERKPVEG